ncbi:glyoxalase/bleomycin resistance protein/dioxygenase [Rhodanobacter fulvus Jip2]|uniref:Glyoxalase/bleomycin resistance protein/dioxygenase n=1 Tax=Rhodanobacter fulvus Jip2 TaxID=1163408 RepID=I4W0V0_9GAMM|nr:VOC family protein [Rhodanobacter fulvus]EIL93091.1 glyoxalase/bleomycin resistance protein/dioxygenase [Rhodanobacter fulvus Jip2]
MPRNLYVNLPVKDLARSVDFFEALEFSFNPKFTDENAACLIINERTGVMLLAENFFAGFTNKPIADARASTETLLALSLDSRADVEAFMAKALAAGATPTIESKDYGFMYQHGFADPDGHQWEVFWMDEAQMPNG